MTLEKTVKLYRELNCYLTEIGCAAVFKGDLVRLTPGSLRGIGCSAFLSLQPRSLEHAVGFLQGYSRACYAAKQEGLDSALEQG